MKICVANAKGGTGKTTSSVYLAALLARRGEPVTLVDADPQGSAAEWLEIAPMPGVRVVEAPSERLLVRTLAESTACHVVVDTPPGNERLIRASIVGADSVVIPARTGAVEISRVQVTLSMIPPGTPAGLALTMAESQTIDFRSQSAAWSAAGVWVLGAIPKRVSVARGPDGPLNMDALDAYATVLDSIRPKEVA